MSKILENKNIVLTRAKNQAVESIKAFEDLGANVISFPTIKISPIVDSALDETLKNINNFDTIIFTSENAVKYFVIKLNELSLSFDSHDFLIISIGNKTTAICNQNNIKVNFQPKKSTLKDLLFELESFDFFEKKIFVPCSSLSNHNQFNSLKRSGTQVKLVPIYENNTNDKKFLLEEIKIITNNIVDLFIFTSPSTFNGFIKIMEIENPKKYFDGKTIAVIGPVTEKALNDAGIKSNIIPENHSMNYLIEEIKKYYTTKTTIN